MISLTKSPITLKNPDKATGGFQYGGTLIGFLKGLNGVLLGVFGVFGVFGVLGCPGKPGAPGAPGLLKGGTAPG